jgi:hypothetical protein
MLENLTPPSPFKGSCKVGQIMLTLSATDQEILTAAIFDTANWPIKTLAKALNERGLQISDTPLTSHRFKNCACFRA